MKNNTLCRVLKYLKKDIITLNMLESDEKQKLKKNYVYPKKNPITGKLEVLDENRGLYIQGLTDAEEGKEKTFFIQGLLDESAADEILSDPNMQILNDIEITGGTKTTRTLSDNHYNPVLGDMSINDELLNLVKLVKISSQSKTLFNS